MKPVVVEASSEPSLNEQVWDHERRAKQLGLQLVVEVYAKKNPTSKAISKLWRKKSQAISDTLHGIYLLRVDLLAVGPKRAIELTPYVFFGVPLFVAWNPLGQLLTSNAFSATGAERLIETLSAYFADVAAGRKHELHPAPTLPRATPDPGPRGKRRGRAVVPVHPTGDYGALQVELGDGSSRANASAPKEPTVAASQEPAELAPNQPATAASEEPAELAREERAAAASEEPTQTASEELTPVQRLAANLDVFLDNALDLAKQFLRQCDCRDDESLHSLRQLDVHLDENLEALHSPEFVRQNLVPLGVYLGAVVRRNASARWFVDETQESPIEALALSVQSPSGERVFRPTQVALERLTDSDTGFYGQAVDMCRKF